MFVLISFVTLSISNVWLTSGTCVKGTLIISGTLTISRGVISTSGVIILTSGVVSTFVFVTCTLVGFDLLLDRPSP